MNQTQLASMFLGRPLISSDDFNRLQGIKSTLGNIIHITHAKTDNILDVVTAKNIISNEHFKSLKTGEDTFEFETFGEMSFDEHLQKGNRLIVPGEDEDEYLEFIIDSVIDKRSNYKTVEVLAYASYAELNKAKVIDPFTFKGTAEQHLARALQGTEHSVGFVESNRDITISFNNHTNPYEYIKRIEQEFELEVIFRVEHNGLRVVSRPVDLVDKIGSFRGREFTFGKDLEEIKRIESGEIYTALIGLGPEPESGKRKEVFVEDLDALEIWGRPGRDGKLQHLIGVYEPQSERDDMTETELRRYTQTELNKRKQSVLTYEIGAIDLEHFVGHSEKITRFGDVIRAKDTYFKPHLYVEARIFEMKRDVVIPKRKEYAFGDFVEYDEFDIHSFYNRIKATLDKKASIALLKEYAEPKRIESPTPPTGQTEHVIWIDTSKTPYVAKVFNGGRWVNLSPTTAAEIDAYNKRQIDDKNKAIEDEAKRLADDAEKEAKRLADQARKDAEAFAENANNIKEGVIDVGQVPLRTSVTGARLEWDGLNGLVQYDQKGNPVSWLDLEANAHFANAFLSGRIEALEGYFGKNKRVTVTDDGLTIQRPDGAVWMQNGTVKQDYSISGFDPYMSDALKPDFFIENVISAFNASDSWYTQFLGDADGRKRSNGHGGTYKDIRDEDLGFTIRFQRYEFIHSSRYLTIGYQIANNSGVPQHRFRVYEIGSVPSGAKDMYTSRTFNKGVSGHQTITIDLGVPTYLRRRFDIRLGWLKQWGSPEDFLRFRITRLYLSDE